MIMYSNEAIIKSRRTSMLVNLLRQPHNGEDKARSSQYLLIRHAIGIRWFHVSSGRRVHPPSKLQNHSF